MPAAERVVEPEFGLCYSAKVRVPIRDSPAVSSATLDAVMAGECVRVERVVISEQGVPKIGIVLPTDGGGSGARWGWASYASVSDGSPLWSALKEAPPSTFAAIRNGMDTLLRARLAKRFAWPQPGGNLFWT